MKVTHLLELAALAGLASCGRNHQPQEPAKNATAPVVPAPSAPPAVANSEAPPAPAPAPSSPPAATKPTVDPKSTEAAVALVQGFADLLNQGKFNQAYMLLGPNAPARNQFDSAWTHIEKLHVTLGTAGRQEGAAGSIYLTVPLDVSGQRNGERVARTPGVILRRVNDVPGSTEAQRHWHIERIDWSGGA